MRTRLKWTGVATAVLGAGLGAPGRSDAAGRVDLARGFADPPADTRPGCYWYWMSDHVSRDGITKDLEAMARVGIGEAYIGNIDLGGPPGPVKLLSDESFDAMAHAVREGRRTGVKVGLFNCPGWSQSGGPWVTPAQSMRYVVGSQTRVTGPTRFSAKLAAPAPHFQDVAVLAYPEPAHDRDTLAARRPAVTSAAATQPSAWVDGDASTASTVAARPAGEPPVVVDLAVDQPFTARALSLVPGPKRFAMRCELLADDADGRTVVVKAFEADRSADNFNVGPMTHAPVTVSFPAVTSRRFRLRFSPTSEGGALPAMDVAEIELSGGARLERAVEKQLGKMHPTPQPTWASYLWPTQAEPEDRRLTIDPAAVRNLSAQLAPDGTLTWDVPPGDWIIERLGMTPTGAKNSPTSPAGTGYEIDKMSRDVIAGHYDAYVGKVVARLTPDEVKAAGHVIADSYEMGSQNWTDGFDRTFKARYGYDPLPWLPVLGGRLVGSAAQSERFLWDLRRLVADRVATEYVGGLRDLLAGKGLRLWLENYGHWGFPSEFMRYGGESNDIGGEFWIGPGGQGELGGTEVRAAASTAHGYGKLTVSAEAFTSATEPFQRAPWHLKTRGDWAMSEGVNRFVLHVYIHQPDERSPGTNAWFGTEFNRKNTWFEASRGWIDYLRRSHFLLRQGRYAADVAYFIGEDAPKMTGTLQPALPAGYSYDFINAELIERLSVRDGALVLPGGMSYRLLVLPPQATMRPELLAKLKDLVAAGAAVLGPAPLESPSMQDFPAADARVRQMAGELWQNADGKAATRVGFGKGQVFNGVTVQSALDALGVPPDVKGLEGPTLLWTHRTDDAFDLYFISNQKDEPQTVTPSFRVAGRQPEVWNAVTGERRDLPRFAQRDGRTEVPLTLEPRESLFVVFTKPAPAAAQATQENFPPLRTLKTLDGPWTVSFDAARGAPASVVFERLTDWTQRPEEPIRHYSGTATYRQTFDVPDLKAGTPLFLELGEINGIARVRLNGTDLGSVWCAPWHVNAAAAAKASGNTLEVEVTNNWVNQLLLDAGRPAEQRATWTASPVNLPGVKPQSSGLIGPVLVRTR